MCKSKIPLIYGLFFIQSLFSWVVFAKYKLVTLFYLENLFIVSIVCIRCEKAFICCMVDFSLKACCNYLTCFGAFCDCPLWRNIYCTVSLKPEMAFLIWRIKYCFNLWNKIYKLLLIYILKWSLNNHNIYMYLILYLILWPPIYVVALKINPIKIYIFESLETQE